MYISNLKLWNFRKFGTEKEVVEKIETPDVEVKFERGINLLVGENDSGKTVILDALKLILLTNSNDYIRVLKDDFFQGTNSFRIEIRIEGFDRNEAKNFIEYLSVSKEKKGENTSDSFYLRLFIEVEKDSNDKVGYYELKAGADNEGTPMRGNIRDLLKVMYLKPLRDAENELKAKDHSRLSQILQGHNLFKKKTGEEHELEKIIQKANNEIKNYFSDQSQKEKGYEKITKELENSLNRFLSKRKASSSKTPKFDISDANLTTILSKLNLKLAQINPGLGTLNILFIAAEMLLLKRQEYSGLKLGLIEELEAHLHTQQQMRVLKYLEELTQENGDEIQLILTTHSTHIASKVNPKNLIMLNSDKAFSLNNSQLNEDDYEFLKKFLDSTKSNLFFAEGIILVEGFAENIILPIIAKIIDRDLTAYGVSIVNVQSTALMRYAKIFSQEGIKIPIACVIDLDVKYEKEGKFDKPEQTTITEASRQKADIHNYNNETKTFVSPNWTLEFDIALSKNLRELFYQAAYLAGTEEDVSTLEKQVKKKKEASDKLQKWINSNNDDQKIAYMIYNKCCDNKASTALWFSRLLDESSCDFKIKLKNDSQVKYLIDAIYHVTENEKNDETTTTVSK